MVIRSPSLTSLGLRSLRHINDGAVYITGNKKLCYVDTVNWTAISSSSRRRQKNDVKDNRPVRECGEWEGMFEESGSLSVMVIMFIVVVFFSCLRFQSPKATYVTVCAPMAAGVREQTSVCPVRTTAGEERVSQTACS